MKQWLKCIGGPCDGQLEWIEEHCLHVAMHGPLRPHDFIDFGGAAPPMEVKDDRPRPIYTRRFLVINVGSAMERIEFLAPEAMSDLEALRHVLAP